MTPEQAQRLDDRVCDMYIAARQGLYDNLSVDDHLELVRELIREFTDVPN